jgi:hypothetical protein
MKTTMKIKIATHSRLTSAVSD